MSAADAPTVRRPFFKRKKTCPFSGENAPAIDWKDVRTLSRYISERGKIVPSRITAVSQKNSGSCPKRSSEPATWRFCPMYARKWNTAATVRRLPGSVNRKFI